MKNIKFPKGFMLITILLISRCVFAGEVLITTQAVADNDNDKYTFQALQLALSYSQTKYRFKSDPSQGKTLGRVISDLDTGVTDVMWTATDKEKEKIMLPIRIPLFKGMFGYRVLLINKNNQEKFEKIKTLEDLQTLTFGQGTLWADTKILEANGLKVIKTMKYGSLVYMTDGGRFDAFPRGIHEPWSEIANYPTLNLGVEPNILLVYKMPFYLFVNKNNKALAGEIENGLNRAIADGSFDKIFFATNAVQQVIKYANIRNRRIIELKNPDLPEATPVDRAELWLDLKKF